MKKLDKVLHGLAKLFEKGNAVSFLWENAEGWPTHYVGENVFDLLGYEAWVP